MPTTVRGIAVVLSRRSLDGLVGYITVSDNTPDEGDTLTLTFVETSITGEFTASDLTPDEGDELTLEFVPVAYTYQWKKNGSNLSDGGDISGATTEELTITNADPDDDGDYTVEVTNPTTGRVRTFGPENIAVIPLADSLLLETGDQILLETGDALLIDAN